MLINGKHTKSILLISQHLWGTGHLIRTAAIAAAIAEHTDWRVTHISGGPPIANFLSAKTVRFVQLPAVQPEKKFSNKQIPVETGLSLEEAHKQRLHVIKDLLKQRPYDAVITEFYPFAAKRMADIMDPILKFAHTTALRTRFICSIRDIPVGGGSIRDLYLEANYVNNLLRSSYDAVWHHTDPSVIDFSQTPGLKEATRGVDYSTTGYILSHVLDSPRMSQKTLPTVLVTVGGGRDGHEIIALVLKELLKLIPHQVKKVYVVCGPLMSDQHMARIQDIVKKERNIQIYKQVSNLTYLMAQCSVVISMAGYNTTVEATSLKRPLLLVPRKNVFEQELRAKAFSQSGFALYWPQEVHNNNLSKSIQELLRFQPKGALDTRGAERSLELLMDMFKRKENEYVKQKQC
ncbi:MAG: glycosyltransferase [Candidatus Andersenbacteria bacterium]